MFECESEGQADTIGLKTKESQSFQAFCLPVIFCFAAASHIFTTTMITYKTKQHINISYNCIADIS